jgi:hypothetical protein
MFFIRRDKELEKFSIEKLYKMYSSDQIDDEPYYQRYSDLWSIEKQRLLIDTIINGYDMPKFYFHYILHSDNALNKTQKQYAIIDGKQRIKTIVDFINGVFDLDETVKCLDNPNLNFNKVNYMTIATKREFIEIKERIDIFQLDIIHISTDEFDRIEEMFLRLNEGVPVNNAEKRNSIGGYLIEEANKFVKKSVFFTTKVRFGNKRMEHQDLLLKLCLIERSQNIESFTKKNLDDLVKQFKPKRNSTPKEKSELKIEAEDLINATGQRLEKLSQVFTENDAMLRYKGILPLYYIFLKQRSNISPTKFKSFIKTFDSVRAENRRIGRITKPNTTLLQFDRLNQQGAHQAKSLMTRLKILNFYFDLGTNSFDQEMQPDEIGIKQEDENI